MKEEHMGQKFLSLVSEIGTTDPEQPRDWDATHKDWRAKLFKCCKTTDVLDQAFQCDHMVSVMEFLVSSSKNRPATGSEALRCLKLMMQDSQWKNAAQSDQQLQASIDTLVNRPVTKENEAQALSESPQNLQKENVEENRSPGAHRRCCGGCNLCGWLCCCCKVAHVTYLCVALVLLLVALATSGPGIIVLLEVPIQCETNLLCYRKIFKNVVAACAEARFPPSLRCMQDQFFHTVPSTGFSQENIISVCGLLDWSCFKDRCPEAWDKPCWLWGPEDPEWDANSVGEDRRPLASTFPNDFLNITGNLHKVPVSDMKAMLAHHPEADYVLRMLYILKNPDTSKIHKDAFLSEQVQIMDFDKDNAVTQIEYQNYASHLVQNFPDLFARRQRVVFMGNPGRGKSTLLNALASTILFKAGQATDGEGVTRNMSVKDIPHRVPGYGFWTLVDTPGLADESLRKVAAAEIRKALRSDSDDAGELIPHRMVFVITLLGGRVSEEDKVTMKVILRAAREITSFGIIVNQHPVGLKMDAESQKQTEARILYGLVNEKTSAYLHWFPEIAEARFENNVLIPGGPVEELWTWINSLPPVHIRDVDALELADMKDLLAEVQAELKELKESREKQNKMIEKMEKDRQKAEKKAAEDAKTIKEQQERLAKLEEQMRRQARTNGGTFDESLKKKQ